MSSSLKLNLIVACDANMGIGVKNDLPWKLRKEMAYFTRMTTGISSNNPGSVPEKRNIVLMGRKTYDSIPDKFRPLKNRLNIVLSRNTELQPNKDLIVCKSWEESMTYLSQSEVTSNVDKVWVIGGSSIYKMGVESPFCYRIYLTKLLQKFECDTFFPTFDESKFQLVKDPDVPEEEQEEGDIRYTFKIYEKLSN